MFPCISMFACGLVAPISMLFFEIISETIIFVFPKCSLDVVLVSISN